MKTKKKSFIENPFVAVIIFMSLLMGSNFMNFESHLLLVLYGVQVISLIYMFIIYIYKSRMSSFFFLVLFFIMMRAFSSIINQISIYHVITQSISLLLSVLFVELLAVKNPKVLINSMFVALLGSNLINFVSIHFMANGFYLDTSFIPRKVYLFGIANQQGIVLLFSLGLFLIVLKISNGVKKIAAIVGIICVMINCFTLKSATLLITSSLLLVLILFFLNTKLYKYISIKTMLVVYYLVWFLTVFVKISKYMSFLFVNILGKSADLSYRTILFDNAINLIKAKPWLGYGVRDGLYLYRNIGIAIVRQSSHNLFLQILIEGGIVSLFIFTAILFTSAKRLSKFHDDYFSSVLSISIIAILILSLSEVFGGLTPLYILLSMGYMYPYIRTYFNDAFAQNSVDIKIKN